MNTSHKQHVFNILKKRISLYLVIIVLGISGVVVISFYSGGALKKSALLIDDLGRQRMLTQVLSKNASRLSVIQNAMQSNGNIQSDDVLTKKISFIDETLGKDMEAFENTYAQLRQGAVSIDGQLIKVSPSCMSVLIPMLDELDLMWNPFKKALATLRDTTADSVAFKQSLIYINENNEALLNQTEGILKAYEKSVLDRYEKLSGVILMLIGIILFFTSYFMYLMYTDLFKALNVFYNELEKYGFQQEGAHLPRGKEIADEVRSMLMSFNEILELTEKINTHDSFADTLDYIYKAFEDFLPYTYIGIALLKEDDPDKVVASYGISDGQHIGLAESLAGYEARLADTSLKQIMNHKEPRVINDLEAYLQQNGVRPYSQVVYDHGIRSSITLPLEANGLPLGFIFFSSNRKDIYQKKHIEYLKIISSSIALSFQKNIFVDDLVYSSVLALAKLSEARDEDTGDHLVRMSKYVEAIAIQLRECPKYSALMSREYVAQLVKFSPMHDIGKVGIPDAILLKPAKLTSEEFEIMKTHTMYGANVLGEAERNVKRKGRSLFALGIEIAQNHHERYDGTGYPNGLEGEAIPLAARIVTVADVFDALLSKRPYKQAFSEELSHKIINDGKGTHFDPDVVDAFNAIYPKLLSIKDYFDARGDV